MIVKAFEILTLGLAAVLTGLIAGIGFMLMGAPGVKRMIIGWADIYPDFPIPLHVDGATVFLIFILGLVPLLAGALVPIWKIGTLDPDQAIRQ
jgi:ABC-type antimicrobial peptide transport system permease subunit